MKTFAMLKDSAAARALDDLIENQANFASRSALKSVLHDEWRASAGGYGTDKRFMNERYQIILAGSSSHWRFPVLSAEESMKLRIATYRSSRMTECANGRMIVLLELRTDASPNDGIACRLTASRIFAVDHAIKVTCLLIAVTWKTSRPRHLMFPQERLLRPPEGVEGPKERERENGEGGSMKLELANLCLICSMLHVTYDFGCSTGKRGREKMERLTATAFVDRSSPIWTEKIFYHPGSVADEDVDRMAADYYMKNSIPTDDNQIEGSVVDHKGLYSLSYIICKEAEPLRSLELEPTANTTLETKAFAFKCLWFQAQDSNAPEEEELAASTLTSSDPSRSPTISNGASLFSSGTTLSSPFTPRTAMLLFTHLFEFPGIAVSSFRFKGIDQYSNAVDATEMVKRRALARHLGLAEPSVTWPLVSHTRRRSLFWLSYCRSSTIFEKLVRTAFWSPIRFSYYYRRSLSTPIPRNPRSPARDRLGRRFARLPLGQHLPASA
ncbi:uncharacterized protein MYCFIDRAFT_172472 [Pseudocercospora fijiensis CIRAD86]|uniref:Uncharacterized protein n=1 Tax=Pseudocercospora fijiensis (strain CIRAD86) TaxID=383855 RepID=M3BBY6_PSEFD|nr:uncharacterized protein MYCFIDRAFT_172472 [Pseudocercospora fijiensis CIRAD86]EME86777.1 hypothetical protein MYCFIDRAFT_172472 [Pseudocercospora fijiensis CIRAD86]